jgi:hypothetical protein
MEGTAVGEAGTEEEDVLGPDLPTTIRREDLELGQDVEDEPSRGTPSDVPHQPSTTAVAEAALRDAVSAVQGLAERARNYVAELSSMESRTKNVTSEAAAEQTEAGRGLMTEASATVLTEYLKHFFDLVSMQNRLLERRLDSLEALIARLDQHVTEDAAEISSRLATLEGVQLPLVKAPESERHELGAESEPVTGPAQAASEQDVPGPATETASAGAAQPDDAWVKSVVEVRGLPNFRALFALRDELRRRPDIYNAEAASFEGGTGSVRIKAVREPDSRDILEALREATGLEFAEVGPMSFDTVQQERQTA